MSAAAHREEFIHRFAPGRPGTKRTLLLLHGTGGDERDLEPLGTLLDPDAAQLAPRGAVLENGMPRFFRRLSEGVFDLEDLRERTHDLAEFIRLAATRYGFDPGSVVAVGFSNGANIAASLVLLHPGVLAGAVLLSPMVPFQPESGTDLAGVPVFIGAGRADTIARPEQAERLAELLREHGARVTPHWHPGGHGIDRTTVSAARDWLATSVPDSRR
jgi:predicted esterase